MDSNEQDRTARKLLMSVLPMAPKTPRDAYEMVKGGSASDAEWAQYGAAWERNWDECVELYRIVSATEEHLRAAYERHKNS